MTTIFIISSHPLFSYGLESLIRQETGAIVIGQETNVNRAIESIKELQPDVIILDNDDTLEPSPDLLRLLKAISGIKVISLNLQNNSLHVYRTIEQIVRDTQDLVKAIESDQNSLEFANNNGCRSRGRHSHYLDFN
jgi:DNA-binding NarL/FixJ family response regulator